MSRFSHSLQLFWLLVLLSRGVCQTLSKCTDGGYDVFIEDINNAIDAIPANKHHIENFLVNNREMELKCPFYIDYLNNDKRSDPQKHRYLARIALEVEDNETNGQSEYAFDNIPEASLKSFDTVLQMLDDKGSYSTMARDLSDMARYFSAMLGLVSATSGPTSGVVSALNRALKGNPKVRFTLLTYIHKVVQLGVQNEVAKKYLCDSVTVGACVLKNKDIRGILSKNIDLLSSIASKVPGGSTAIKFVPQSVIDSFKFNLGSITSSQNMDFFSNVLAAAPIGMETFTQVMRWSKGEITARDGVAKITKTTARVGGSLAGAYAGGYAGQVVGSAFGPAGGYVGGMVGAAVGGFYGGELANTLWTYTLFNLFGYEDPDDAAESCMEKFGFLKTGGVNAIKANYRKQSIKYHPDKVGEETADWHKLLACTTLMTARADRAKQNSKDWENIYGYSGDKNVGGGGREL